MDRLSKEQRSLNMSRIHSNDTKPELLVRSWLHKNGFRFRLHVKTLPGHPDIVLSKYKTIVEVRGCFWHHHKNCLKASIPKSNVEFWQRKLQKNVQRDEKHEKEWKELGWNLIVVWTCELDSKSHLNWTRKFDGLFSAQ